MDLFTPIVGQDGRTITSRCCYKPGTYLFLPLGPHRGCRYALRADDPSGSKSTTQHGANRLAALGLASLTVAPEQRGGRVRLQVMGGRWERNEFSFYWPIWTLPVSLAAIRALLSHPNLARGPASLANMNVVDVRRAQRIGVGKFMNFTRASSVRAET